MGNLPVMTAEDGQIAHPAGCLSFDWTAAPGPGTDPETFPRSPTFDIEGPRSNLIPLTLQKGKAMRMMLVSLVLSAALALPALAGEREDGIAATINGQMQALNADDFETAFSFASPMIKGMFGTPENFGAMVSQGYPMVHHPSDVKLLELREVADGLWQRVMVTDPDGSTHLLDYQMIETPEGWQINAVQLLRDAGVGA
jgi:Domain of unknown function (DUF4864)